MNIMTLRLKKTGICSICGQRTHTEFHHILGRPTKELANDEWNVIEICQLCHINSTTYLRLIFNYQIDKYGLVWLDWYLINCKSPKGILYDIKGYALAQELKEENE